jgi:acyl dehydratase
MAADLLHHEDIELGRALPLGSRTVTAEEIIAFARLYDPQPFHLDDEAARATPLGGLVASGWHTAGLMMRLYVDNLLAGMASMGSPGIEQLDWLAPVRPGDTLTGTFTAVGKRVSKSRPEMGLLSIVIHVDNQHGTRVLEMRATALCATRERAA